MLIYNDDLVVNDINITPYLTSCTFGYNKLWGSDTGRNSLSGKYSGTLIGVFPKFECTFRKLTKTEIEALAPVFDSVTQQVTYYDPNKKQKITIETYSGDYTIEQSNLYSKVAKSGKGVKISFIATAKRS